MSQSGKSYSGQLGLASCLAIGGTLSFGAVDCVSAQSAIIRDHTLGNESSRVEPNYQGNPIELLTGGAIRGTNLFHSFQEFNVSKERGAYFLIPSRNIQNVITRVTGSNRSEILGALGTRQIIDNSLVSSNANLFLINPNGIIFGPNTSLSLGGSFVASTASSIKFADGTLLSVKDPQTTPLLTVSVPIGLQFGRTPGDIIVQGIVQGEIVQGGLAVLPGKTLALVGGNVNLDGGVLQASGGQIALGGILEAGTIGLNLNSNNQPLSFPNNVVLADVSLSNGALLDVSDEGSGNIQVQGRLVTLTDVSQLMADTYGSLNGRGIYIGAEQLTIKDGSQVTTSTFGKGFGGSLTVTASDSARVVGTNADGNPSSLLVRTSGEGMAGNLTINTRNLIVQDGANVSASTDIGSQGRGGTLNVTASDSVKLSGISEISKLSSGLFAQTQGNGDAGSLTIDTNSLTVENGAQVSTGTYIGSQGKGGDLTVHARDFVKLSGTGPNGQDTGLLARTRGSGDAGPLTINTGLLIVERGSQVTVGGIGSGNAGELQLTARALRLDGGKLSAQTSSGQGGNIRLQGLDLLLLRNNSQITTTADTSRVGADVAGGNININSKLIVAVPNENSDITANAFNGRGGNVSITTQGIFGIQPREQQTPQTNDITATSELGINGRIQINTPEIDPSRGLISLPAQRVDASRQITRACTAGDGINGNTFVDTRRGGLPPSPNEPLSSDVVWSDTRIPATIQQQYRSKKQNQPHLKQKTVEIVPATGWVLNDKGEVVLISNVPNNTYSRSESTPATCK